jgi:hypothetical protein
VPLHHQPMGKSWPWHITPHAVYSLVSSLGQGAKARLVSSSHQFALELAREVVVTMEGGWARHGKDIQASHVVFRHRSHHVHVRPSQGDPAPISLGFHGAGATVSYRHVRIPRCSTALII